MRKFPVAPRRPHEVVSPHGTRQDPYYWLRDDERKNADVMAYLDAENAYTTAVLAPARRSKMRCSPSCARA
jgi:oligopeptidase B